MGADLLSGIWSGAMRLIRWGLLWLLVGCSPAAAQIPEEIQQALHHRGHALLIGVSNYTTGGAQLPSVKNDLDDLEAGLKPYFETVDTLPNPTVAKIKTRIHDFLVDKWNKPNERLFIYYSGHGFTDFNQSSRQNDGYITGSDTPLYNQTDGRAVANAVPFVEIDSWNRQTKARHVLMVFDSCFSGSLFQTKGTNAEPSQYDYDSARKLVGQPIRWYITAGSETEEVTADGTFATQLLRGLGGEADKYKQGFISAEELGIYLGKTVPGFAKRVQTPQSKSILNAQLSKGQFFFLTGLAAARGERRVVSYANGDRYDGEFRDAAPNGHGVLTFPSGAQYDGEFRDGKYNGRGVLTYANGDRYDGEFRDGKENGRGVYTYANGRRYDGEWRDGKEVSRIGQ